MYKLQYSGVDLTILLCYHQNLFQLDNSEAFSFRIL